MEADEAREGREWQGRMRLHRAKVLGQHKGAEETRAYKGPCTDSRISVYSRISTGVY
jgi:hypothetical protein